MQVKNELLTN